MELLANSSFAGDGCLELACSSRELPQLSAPKPGQLGCRGYAADAILELSESAGLAPSEKQGYYTLQADWLMAMFVMTIDQWGRCWEVWHRGGCIVQV
eukprot:1158438-Pelagomonas_calceolata.AAC.7